MLFGLSAHKTTLKIEFNLLFDMCHYYWTEYFLYFNKFICAEFHKDFKDATTTIPCYTEDWDKLNQFFTIFIYWSISILQILLCTGLTCEWGDNPCTSTYQCCRSSMCRFCGPDFGIFAISTLTSELLVWKFCIFFILFHPTDWYVLVPLPT